MEQRTHRTHRYVKDVDKVHGKRDRQVGFRLSATEEESIQQVLKHWEGISFANWVSYVMLRFVETQTPERTEAARRWAAPSPAPHCRSSQVTTHTHDRFMQHFPGLPVSHMVRWAMLDEAPRVLAGPSRAEQAEAREALKKKLLDTSVKMAHVIEPTGYLFTGEDE